MDSPPKPGDTVEITIYDDPALRKAVVEQVTGRIAKLRRSDGSHVDMDIGYLTPSVEEGNDGRA